MHSVVIVPFTLELNDALQQHLQRHRAESGRGDIHFMPFAPDEEEGPRFITLEKAFLPLDQPGWQRWFCAREKNSGEIIGHVDLKGDGLRTGLHRCELGIGIERAWRGKGLGERLMQAAIDFAKAQPGLCWLDLKHFAHNRKAAALYQRLGFQQLGVMPDRFRVAGQSIDDVLMTLPLR